MKFDYVIVVAPYMPPGEEITELAAAKKIEGILRISNNMSKRVIFVDSAHISKKFSMNKFKRKTIADQRIIYIQPFTVPNRKLGKLLNLCYPFLPNVISRFVGKNKKALLWLYNGYAFECLLGNKFSGRAKVLLEMEDMPFSRKRGFLEIKDRVDQVALNKISSKLDVLTVVNKSIISSLPLLKKDTKITEFPSLLAPNFLDFFDKKIKFNKKNKIIIGYFGGLSEDKGGKFLCELSSKLPNHYELHVTGCGEYENKLQEIADHKDNIYYHGMVDENKLYEVMSLVDVFVNPHKSLKDMDYGVYPFKVFEYLATGKLLISTELPSVNTTIDNSIVFFDGSLLDFLKKLQDLNEIYKEKKYIINEARDYVLKNYTENSFTTKLQGLFS